jgi:hypothetical protein
MNLCPDTFIFLSTFKGSHYVKKMIIESYPPNPSKLNLGLKALGITFLFSATSALAVLPVA